jgi:hypothetical protein
MTWRRKARRLPAEKPVPLFGGLFHYGGKVVTETSSNGDTIYAAILPWRGTYVMISHPQGYGSLEMLDCPHEIEVMHHLGDDNKHYCPTTFIWCGPCGAVGNEPEPYECERWGE